LCFTVILQQRILKQNRSSKIFFLHESALGIVHRIQKKPSVRYQRKGGFPQFPPLAVGGKVFSVFFFGSISLIISGLILSESEFRSETDESASVIILYILKEFLTLSSPIM